MTESLKGSQQGSEGEEAGKLPSSTLLDAVNDAAYRCGVRKGQSIAEACALISHLAVRQVTRDSVLSALGRIAEMAMALGTPVSIDAPDTVWVDVTGAAHLVGGEAELVSELYNQVRVMGHRVRVSVANGPWIARAFARWAESEKLVIPSARTAEALSELPVLALPLDRECSEWLVRLGVLTIAELAALPRAAAAARLGQNASQILDLCRGIDTAPLVSYQPPRVLVEETEWDEPVEGLEPLLFVMRGLVSRMSARLSGRGEAAQTLKLIIRADRTISKMNHVEQASELCFELGAPLSKEADLCCVLKSRLERMKLKAPSVGMRLEVPSITMASTRQLNLLESQLLNRLDNVAFSVLLAELYADVGKQRVGILELVDSHRPEAQSALFLAERASSSPSLRKAVASPKKSLGQERKSPGQWPDSLRKSKTLPSAQNIAEHRTIPTRLLPQPLRLEVGLRPGTTLPILQRLFTIEKLSFEHRLDTEWWTNAPASRDYFRLWLSSTEGSLEALVFVDRVNGTRFLQAIID
ncbi:MAG TPA: DNA polymerase Y family protein [Polyangiaceae bacterium]